MLSKLSQALTHFNYRLDPQGAYPRQAAVLIAFTNEADPKLVLTKRSSQLTRHSGEVSFPGGWLDQTDRDLAHTALREAHEEVGLEPGAVALLGNWRSRYARGGIRVQPVVGVIDDNHRLAPNPDELEAVFKVPLSFFLNDPRIRTDIFSDGGQEFWVPAYRYNGFEIWGFTAGVLTDLLNQTLGAGIVREHVSAPVRYFKR